MPLRPMQKRVLLAAAISWGFSVTLGLLFAICASGRFDLSALSLPAVVPVALLGSTVAAAVITPLAAWSVRTGKRNLLVYGPVLWIINAAYIFLVAPRSGGFGLYGSILLAAIGLIVLGLIPARRTA